MGGTIVIIKQSKDWEIHSSFPNTDWDNNGNYVVDETSESGKSLADKIIANSPYFNFVLDSEGVLVDITPTERPLEPQQQITFEERVTLQQEAIDFILMNF